MKAAANPCHQTFHHQTNAFCARHIQSVGPIITLMRQETVCVLTKYLDEWKNIFEMDSCLGKTLITIHYALFSLLQIFFSFWAWTSQQNEIIRTDFWPNSSVLRWQKIAKWNRAKQISPNWRLMVISMYIYILHRVHLPKGISVGFFPLFCVHMICL